MMSVFGFERVTVLKVTLVAAAAVLAGCLLALLETAKPVEAAFPGTNGKIAFTRSGEIYTMNADGSGVVNLTNNSALNEFPVFSPDGTKIAFASQHDDLVIIETDIYSMNPDGSGQVNLTNNPALDSLPAFSPDGTKIAFYSERDVYNGQINGEIYTMNPDGSGQVNLTNSSPDFDLTPNWGPLVRPTYDFSGFFQPVDNLPTLNKTKAGKTIPIRFSLGGDKGLDIFDNIENPNPKSEPIDCATSAPIDEIEQTVTGTGSLSYNAGSGRYEYDWATSSSWSGTCRQFVMKLNDGTVHRANFTFK